MSYHKSCSAHNIEYFNEGYHPHLGYLVEFNEFQIIMPNGNLVGKTITEGKELSYIQHWKRCYGVHTVDIRTQYKFNAD